MGAPDLREGGGGGGGWGLAVVTWDMQHTARGGGGGGSPCENFAAKISPFRKVAKFFTCQIVALCYISGAGSLLTLTKRRQTNMARSMKSVGCVNAACGCVAQARQHW